MSVKPTPNKETPKKIRSIQKPKGKSTSKGGFQVVGDTLSQCLNAEWTTGPGKVNLIFLCGSILICFAVAIRNPVENYGFLSLGGYIIAIGFIALVSVSLASWALEQKRPKRIPRGGR